MTKVILDFQNLRNPSELDKHLQAMADAAKNSQESRAIKKKDEIERIAVSAR